MGYLEDFRRKVEKDDYQGFLHLWEEYCAGEEVDAKELASILSLLRGGRFGGRFGEFAETALPLWEKIADPAESLNVLRLIFDLQTTHSPELAEIAYLTLEEYYADQEHFDEKIRLVGLRARTSFQGAIRNYELLTHLDKGRFVMHTGGWGTGEVVDLSLVREEIVLEFEGISGRKHLSFDNTFETLEPIDDGHFLARRFGDPDALEELARKEPITVIRMLLKDLGPKSASELKDELCDLVIPAADWTKWWQATRGKIKKDTMIETPGAVRNPFRLREEEVSHASRLECLLEKESLPGAILLHLHNFVRDFPEVQKSGETKEFIRERLSQILAQEGLGTAHRLEAYALLEELFGPREVSLSEAVSEVSNLPRVVTEIEIAAFKKRVLVAARESRSDWMEIFLESLFSVRQSSLRDYLFRELDSEGSRETLLRRIEELVETPTQQPQLFVWFFQKATLGEGPYSDPAGQCRLLEALLSLLYQVEQQSDQRELVKKILAILTGGRFGTIRAILKESSLAFAQEFLLLCSKCQTFNDHDVQILQSLAQVAHPNLEKLASRRARVEEKPKEILWTTQEGYERTQERVRYIGTVEVIDNAKEIEKAREYGDLRENSEFKYAQERRARLQGELRRLTEQLHRAQVLTPNDVSTDSIGIGSIVELTNSSGKTLSYTLLGPWDADPENNILSVQSRLAQTMVDLKKGDTFTYQEEEFTVAGLSSFFDARSVR